MTNAAVLRERAEHYRELAREYDPEVARPLIDKAAALDWNAAELERNGLERRQPRLTAREAYLFPTRPVFGRRRKAAD